MEKTRKDIIIPNKKLKSSSGWPIPPFIDPSIDEIEKAPEQWESLANTILKHVKTLKKRETDRKEQEESEENRINGCDYMASLFREYVTPSYPAKKFNPNAVRIHTKTHYTYETEGVKMLRHGRITWHLDDHDFFWDTKVSVDGHVLLDRTS